MKLSAKKRGQIINLVHDHFCDMRREVIEYLKNNPDKVDYKISQREFPLAQAIMRLLDKDYDNPYK